MLAKVQKLIADGNTELNLTELLDKAEVTEQEYIDTEAESGMRVRLHFHVPVPLLFTSDLNA